MLPRVAIIYLAYNSKPYLDEVVASVENLQYPKDHIEFIIVDNHSPDGSAEVIRQSVVPKSGKSLPRVTFFPNPTNDGSPRKQYGDRPCAARRRGLRLFIEQ